MSDLVERLCDPLQYRHSTGIFATCKEAAHRIEELEAELDRVNCQWKIDQKFIESLGYCRGCHRTECNCDLPALEVDGDE